MVRRARQGIVLLVLLALAAGAVLAFRPKPVPIDLGQVSRGPLVVAVEETGVTRVKDRFVISAPVAGTMSRLALEPGDEVKEGATVAEIAPTLSPLLDERARAQAEARLGAALSALGRAGAEASRASKAHELAMQEFERTRKLNAGGASTPKALEEAEFQVRMRRDEVSSAQYTEKIAQEEVRSARAALGRGGRATDGYVRIASPISGQVLKVMQKSAGVVGPGMPLLEVGDSAALEVVVDLLTTDAVNVRPGTPATIMGWGMDRPLAGRVRLVEPSAFTRPSALGVDEQRVNVMVTLTEPRERWPELADGFRVEVRIALWEAADVVKAPQGGVFRQGEEWAAFRVEGDVARLVKVRLGHRGDREVEVLSGLSPGDRLAVYPGDRVKDGARVLAR
jgi:HlyD family secretion protein